MLVASPCDILHGLLPSFCSSLFLLSISSHWVSQRLVSVKLPLHKNKKSTTKKTSPRNQQKAKQPSPQPTPKRKHLGPSIKKNIPSGKIVNREIVGEVSDEDANRSSAISSGSLAFSGQTWGLIAVEAMEVWETA